MVNALREALRVLTPDELAAVQGPMRDIANVLKDRLSAAAKRVPTRELPTAAGLEAALKRGSGRGDRRKLGAAGVG